LSFGADYLNDWLSPVHHSLGFGHSRQGTAGTRGRFVQIEPRMSLSGAAADEWIPARPGSEGYLALGIAARLVADGIYQGADRDTWRAALAGYSAERVAELTAVPAETITRLAREFGRTQPGLAIGGSTAAAHTNGVDTLVAVNALNYLAGNIGNAGGVVFNPAPVAGGRAASRHASYLSMQQLIEAAQRGSIDVLIVNNTNPAFTLPRASGFADALASIPTIVSLSSFMDETTIMADILLPGHTYLESWGDDMPEPGVGFTVGAISQPVVAPLYKTRPAGDIVLGMAEKLGFDSSMPWDSMEEFLKAGWRRIQLRGATESDDFDAFWSDVLTSGVWGENLRRDDGKVVAVEVIESLTVPAPTFSGNAGDFPFILHPYLSTAMHDGRGANLPWMQELPDPMTSIVYGTWVELNPATAKEIGLRDGDLVTVRSDFGSIEAPVVTFPAIMPDVVAMPIGQGHTALGRYARNRGVNPLELLAPQIDAASGGLATGATRIALAATGRRAAPVRTGGESRQLGRGIVQWTGGSGSPGHSAKLHNIPIKVESA
jgi:anaerobic selenocysteine-containing dehydrogenase